MAKTKIRRKRAKDSLVVKLYVAGEEPKSIAALQNLRNLCEQYRPGQYSIEVIDLLKRPQLAKGDQIFAVPTLVRSLPTPIRKFIGDLSNTDRLLVGLDIKPKLK